MSQKFVTLTAAEWLRKEDVKLAISKAGQEFGDHVIATDHGYGCVFVTAKKLGSQELELAVANGRYMARLADDRKAHE